jgi:hypothetical protein
MLIPFQTKVTYIFYIFPTLNYIKLYNHALQTYHCMYTWCLRSTAEEVESLVLLLLLLLYNFKPQKLREQCENCSLSWSTMCRASEWCGLSFPCLYTLQSSFFPSRRGNLYEQNVMTWVNERTHACRICHLIMHLKCCTLLRYCMYPPIIRDMLI